MSTGSHSQAVVLHAEIDELLDRVSGLRAARLGRDGRTGMSPEEQRQLAETIEALSETLSLRLEALERRVDVLTAEYRDRPQAVEPAPQVPAAARNAPHLARDAGTL